MGPIAPKFKLFPYVWARCIPIAIVAFVITFSAGKTMSVKYGYTVDPNQEMIALGVTNVWGGIFHCLPTSSSLSRAALMDTAGGKTFVSFNSSNQRLSYITMTFKRSLFYVFCSHNNVILLYIFH